MIGSITEELSNGGEVALVGFGTYKVNERAARKVRNLHTGAGIQIAAAKVAAVNGELFRSKMPC